MGIVALIVHCLSLLIPLMLLLPIFHKFLKKEKLLSIILMFQNILLKICQIYEHQKLSRW